LKQHKSWFDEECSKLLDERKPAKVAMIAEFKPNKWKQTEQCKM
jgi:hypothetical protein